MVGPHGARRPPRRSLGLRGGARTGGVTGRGVRQGEGVVQHTCRM